MITSEGLFGYLNEPNAIDPNRIIEELLADMYTELRRQQPDLMYKVLVHLSILKAAGWVEGDLVTKYKIPVTINANIKEVQIGDAYQSDIWIVGKPKQRRKSRHYKK